MKGVRRIALVLVALCLAPLAACDPANSGASGDDATSSATGSPDGPRDPKLEEFLYRRNCDKDLTDKERQVPEVDISQYSWSMPAGFETAYGYSPKIAWEGSYTGENAVPSGYPRGLSLVGFTLFPQLDLGPIVNDCGVVTVDDMLARVAKYREMDSNTAPVDTQVTEVGGLPAVLVSGWDTDLQIQFSDYFIFGRNQLLNITCQWDDQSLKPTIDAACQSLLGSVQFG